MTIMRRISTKTVTVTRISDFLPSAILYVKSTASLLAGVGAQLIGFIILARYLSAGQFGQLMTITATTAIAAGICGLGSDEMMVSRCIREMWLTLVLPRQPGKRLSSRSLCNQS